MKTGLPYGIISVSTTNEFVRCVFCGILVSKSDNSIEEHVGGSRHKNNKGKMESEGISFNDIDTVYCKPCKKNLATDESIIAHIKTEDHANWILTMDELLENEFINISDYLTSDKDVETIFCNACEINVDCTLENIEVHVNNFNHRSNVVEKLKPLNGIFRVENEGEVWCKICKVYIENTVQSIFEHVDQDDNHDEWLDTIQDLISEQNISISAFLAQEHEQKAHCNKCNMDITCNIEEIQEHVFSHLN